MASLLRPRHAHEHGKVTFVELFFDLVFVFAVTQLSHRLLRNLDLEGALETGLLLLATWWVWIFTAWVTNWLDPERTPVRLLLFALMLAGLVYSTALPEAFGAAAAAFALAYVAMQVGRSLFMLWALRGGASPGNLRNFQRITLWLAAAGLLWIAGAFLAAARPWLWLAALAVEYAGPASGFRVPGLGRSTVADWTVEGGHLAERCALFVIIALGESILVTGATFGERGWDAAAIGAFLVAFVGSVALWWIYFDTGAERGSRRIAADATPGRLARVAYTYCHLPIIAGIIVGAAADELLQAHPLGHAEAAVSACLLGGPALFLLGNILFKGAVAGRLPLSHLVGLALLAILAFLAGDLAPLWLGGAATAVLLLVAGWETCSLRRGATVEGGGGV
jgi:low temperature requirement protein LtrA